MPLVILALLLQLAQPEIRTLVDVERTLAAGQPAEALTQLEQVPERSAHWHFLASKAYDALDNPAKAVEEVEAALVLDPGKEVLHLHLGQIFLARNTPSAALEVFTEAQRLFPESLMIRLGKGLALKELQRFDEALTELNTCLRRQPDLALAFDAVGAILIHTKQFDSLKAAALEFEKHSPQDFRGPYYRAEALFGSRSDIPEAETLLRTAIGRNPRFAAAHGLLGKLLLTTSRAAAAIPVLQTAIRLQPGRAQFHFHLARAYRALGQRELAEQAYAAFKEASDQENQPFETLRYRRGKR